MGKPYTRAKNVKQRTPLFYHRTCWRLLILTFTRVTKIIVFCENIFPTSFLEENSLKHFHVDTVFPKKKSNNGVFTAYSLIFIFEVPANLMGATGLECKKTTREKVKHSGVTTDRLADRPFGAANSSIYSSRAVTHFSRQMFYSGFLKWASQTQIVQKIIKRYPTDDTRSFQLCDVVLPFSH